MILKKKKKNLLQVLPDYMLQRMYWPQNKAEFTTTIHLSVHEHHLKLRIKNSQFTPILGAYQPWLMINFLGVKILFVILLLSAWRFFYIQFHVGELLNDPTEAVQLVFIPTHSYCIQISSNVKKKKQGSSLYSYTVKTIRVKLYIWLVHTIHDVTICLVVITISCIGDLCFSICTF